MSTQANKDTKQDDKAAAAAAAAAEKAAAEKEAAEKEAAEKAAAEKEAAEKAAAEKEAAEKAAAAPKINETVKSNEADKLDLRSLNRTGGGYPLTQAEIEQKEKNKRNNLTRKRLAVRTVRDDGNMYYFDADMWITGEPTLVPDSQWLRVQIEAGKIRLADED